VFFGTSSSRSLFYLLVLVNLAFLAWATLVDVPIEPPPSPPISTLPTLKLASEAPARAPTPAPAPSDAAPAAAAPANAETPPQAAAAPAAVTQRCVTVGPFSDLTRAGKAAVLLRDRGFSPRQRAEAGGAWQGYWVYVGGLKSRADQTQVLQRLELSGIRDAHVMPQSEEGWRVSVGLFIDRNGAERRARAVHDLGLNAEVVERKQPAAMYWEDLNLQGSTQTLPMEGLFSLQDIGERLEVRECPKETQGQQDQQPGNTTPGMPVPAPLVPKSLTTETPARPS
jgi:cell division septation protein DedD